MYKIIVADDHPITLLGTETYLITLRHRIVGSYHNGVSCLNGIITLMPDIAIIDISMPGMSGLEILSIIKHKMIPTRIVLLTMHKQLSVYFRAKEEGCDGYVLKDDAQNDLKSCIETVMKGQKYISPRLEEFFVIDKNPAKNTQLTLLTQSERKVLELVAKYMSNKDIGDFLFISEKTVESHKRNITDKLKLPKGKNILLQWAVKNLGEKE